MLWSSYMDSQRMQMQVKLPKRFVLQIWDPSLIAPNPNACAQCCTAASQQTCAHMVHALICREEPSQ